MHLRIRATNTTVKAIAGAVSARGTLDTGEGSWRGLSPSSSIRTMTNSATVTSPDSTGSENGTGSMSALSRSASFSALVMTGYVPPSYGARWADYS